jgi:hypothetical protein
MVHPSPPLASLTAALLCLAVLAPAMSTERDRHKPPPAAVSCAELASAPTLGNPSLRVSVNVALSGSNVAYCQVNLLYSTSPEQNINIRVGLSLTPWMEARAGWKVPGTVERRASAAVAAQGA